MDHSKTSVLTGEQVNEKNIIRTVLSVDTQSLRSEVQVNNHVCVIAALLCCWQLKRLSAAVSFGGGRSQLLEEGSLPRDLLESPQSCVVDATTGSCQTLLPSSATKWANSAKSIVERFAQTPVFLHLRVNLGNLLLEMMICEHFKIFSLAFLLFPPTQKRPPSHHRVRNWFGCHLCFL